LRITTFIALLFLSYAAPLQATTAKEDCDRYKGLSLSEASKEYEELLSLSKKLDLKVGNYLKAGTPQDNPSFSMASKELGNTIGKSYALCVCNQPLSQSNNCHAFIEHMKKSKFVK